MKKSTKMDKVFGAYARRKGVDKAQLRFLVDGERVKVDDTPETLELEDGDQVDVVLEQIGGY